MRYQAEVDITVGAIIAGLQSGNVDLTAGRSIIDGGETWTDVVADGLLMNAGMAIGTAGDHLDTNIHRLTAVATSGGMFVHESNGASIEQVTVEAGIDGPIWKSLIWSGETDTAVPGTRVRCEMRLFHTAAGCSICRC